MLATKMSKANKPSVTFTTRSWNGMSTEDGEEMIDACINTPRFEVFFERTYASGESKVIKMCQPAPTRHCDGPLKFHNNVVMTKDPGEYYYSFSGDVLLNNELEACDVDADCAAGLFCTRSLCQSLPTGSCFLDRGNDNCLLLNDPLRTKCHVAYTPDGTGICGCDNDPQNNPCEDPNDTCDFPCQVPDAIPNCKSPESRNAFCANFTLIPTSVCPAGKNSSPLCTTP
jgi:hypothetical protein